MALQRSNVRTLFNNAIVDTNNASLGGIATISTPGATLNLEPNVGILNKYYYIYYVTTNVSTTVTLPVIANLIKGWKCRLILYSSAGTGSLVVQDSAGTSLFTLTTPNTVARPSVEVFAVKGTTNNWIYIYNMYNVLQKTIFTVAGTNSLVPAAMTVGKFVAYSGAVGSTINVNSTTLIPIPWSSSVTGFFQDNVYFSLSGTSSIITCMKTSFMKIKALIFVGNQGGATSINRANLLIKGLSQNFEVMQGTISTTTSIVWELTALCSASVGNSIEIRVGRSSFSGGTNPLDQGSTCIFIQVIAA